MSTPPIKYNPAFLSDEELAAAFVVRDDDRNIVLRVVRDNSGESNQHVLIIGPRGIGKTMLVQRVALDIRTDEDLQAKWYPLIFAEESYEVGSAGEFWLEAIFHLANQTGDPRWTATYEELRGERDEDRLMRRALAQVLDFADQQQKRILVVVENLNMILGAQLADDCAWKLRHTLMHEPRVMLLATATAQLDLPENTNRAFFELFKTHELRPLADRECRAIWEAIAGHDLGPRRIRALSILTGGNPRLLTIISHFGAKLSFADLMRDLTALVDDHTDYFKSHLEALPPTERKVYVALADLWDPSLARDVARAARQNVSKTSSLLKRLASRGAVTEIPGKGKHHYRVTERMYNVYYLMRRRGAPSERVRAAVKFMVQFYEEKEILEITKRLGTEACQLACRDRRLHFHAFEGIRKAVPPELRSRIIARSPKGFLAAEDQPESLRKLIEEIAAHSALSPRLESLRYVSEGMSAQEAGNAVLAEKAYRKAIELDPTSTFALVLLGDLLRDELEIYDEAEATYRRAIDIDPKCASAWTELGDLLHNLKQHSAAESACRRAVEVDPKSGWTWIGLGDFLLDRKRFTAAESAYREATESEPENFWTWIGLGNLLHEELDQYDEARKAYLKATAVAPGSKWAWIGFGNLLLDQSNHDEAEAAYRRAIEIDAADPTPRIGLVRIELARSTGLERPLELALAALEAIPNDAGLLNALAWSFYKGTAAALPKQVVTWSKQAVEINHSEDNIHSLACILARSGQANAALSLTKELLAFSEYSEIMADDMVTLSAGLAASGHATEAISLLSDSDCATTLEPVLVALRMFLGEEVSVAPEIEQIARDVLVEFMSVQKAREDPATHTGNGRT